MDKKLKQDPAFATSACLFANEDVFQEGMSKRFYAACAAMQGMLTNKGAYWQGYSENLNGYLPEELAKLSYEFADELLKQEYE